LAPIASATIITISSAQIPFFANLSLACRRISKSAFLKP
jgi:hypothetical protein